MTRCWACDSGTLVLSVFGMSMFRDFCTKHNLDANEFIESEDINIDGSKSYLISASDHMKDQIVSDFLVACYNSDILEKVMEYTSNSLAVFTIEEGWDCDFVPESWPIIIAVSSAEGIEFLGEASDYDAVVFTT